MHAEFFRTLYARVCMCLRVILLLVTKRLKKHLHELQFRRLVPRHLPSSAVPQLKHVNTDQGYLQLPG